MIRNWWRQAMMGSAKAHYDGVVAFSQTDFTDDLRRITLPVLVPHGMPTTHAEIINADILAFIRGEQR